MTERIAAIFSRIGEPEEVPPWSSLDVANAVSVLLISIILVGSAAAYLIFRDAPLAVLVGWIIGCLLSVLYDGYVLARQPERRAALHLNVAYGIPVPLMMLFGLGVAILIDLMGRATTGLFILTPELANARQFGIVEWALALVFMVGAQPIAEEIVFRGILLPKARVWIGVWGATLFCSTTYALFHFLVYPPPTQDNSTYWFAFMMPLLAGAFFCLVRAYTSSTRAAILMHAAFGLFAVLRAFVLIS
jgi:membrane protease YdiL (CAAX protease family)